MLAYNKDFNKEEIIEIFDDIKRALTELHMLLGWKTLDAQKKHSDLTALMNAASLCSKCEIIFALLVANPDNINAKDSDGWTALMYAAAFNDNYEVIHELIKDPKVIIEAVNNKGQTALDLARENGNVSAIELLEAAETKNKK